MGREKITVNLSNKEGVPLFKKFAMFDSGFVPLERTCRDVFLFQRCHISSLRMDLFIGERSMELGDMAEETEEGIRYHWEKSDKLVNVLNEHGVSPYYSWCYVPLPVQPEGGNFRSVPTDWKKYQEIMKAFAEHYREQGSPLGYQEIYNEPINPGAFFDGRPEDYNTLYEYGTAGIRQGDPEALVGGPAEAFVYPEEVCRENAADFLDFIQGKNLPLDFFSFHSYGFRDHIYLKRLRLMRDILSEREYFNNAGIHINEVNAVPPPWPYRKTLLEQPALLPQILTVLEELLEETDVELVHWAQMLDSGVDALGLVDSLGRLRPGYFAFELYGRMPVDRAEVQCSTDLGCLASADGERFATLIWNKSDEVKELEESICGIPSRFSWAEVCIIDGYFLDGLEKEPQLRLRSRMRLPVREGRVELSGLQLGISDLVYLEGNAVPEGKLTLNPGLEIRQTLHYYPRRWKKCYAEYDRDSGRVYLGANGCEGCLTILSLKIKKAGSRLRLVRECAEGKGTLVIRMDYLIDDTYGKAVQFGGSLQEFNRGTKRPADILAEEADEILETGRYAPEGWEGESLLSFLVTDADAAYREIIRLTAPASRAFDTLLAE